MRLPPAHPAVKGEFQRITLDLFRDTGGPITSRMVAMRFCENRGFEPDDAAVTRIGYAPLALSRETVEGHASQRRAPPASASL